VTNVTLYYALEIANKGYLKYKALALGVNVFNGKLTCKAVADALNMGYAYAKLLEISEEMLNIDGGIG